MSHLQRADSNESNRSVGAVAAKACHKTSSPAILKGEVGIMGRGNADDISNKGSKEILEGLIGAQARKRRTAAAEANRVAPIRHRKDPADVDGRGNL